MTRLVEPGLLVLHGNRLEFLRDAVFDWIGRTPLAPLEEEIFLVQSNGAAEWLKMRLAEATGVCAATRVELPGRFLWRTYRQVLGRRLGAQSALERGALAWRLMRLLPALLDRPSFAPVAAFLADADLDRRLQLARQLADLIDQYQVYRADWLDAWEAGRPSLPAPDRADQAMPADQRWQMELWRAILGELTRDERASARPHVHRAFLDALAAGSVAPGSDGVRRLPRRVVLFGAAQIPLQTLEALAALSTRVQVVLAVQNPCRYHWADIIEGREALRASRRRQPDREVVPLASVPLDAMHLHANPLLAAWGRQGRDFMRALDAVDDAPDSRRRFDLPRIDLFDDGDGRTLLEQVQARIRDLVPLHERPRDVIAATDRSIVFHVAHGSQREVEILHDRLLALFAGDASLRPRDVVVMVPDIETFAPAIRAVFAQHRRDDARFIPFDIADLRSRGSNPLLVAVEWLLRLPDRRVRLQEVRDLLDVPAIAARVGIDRDALPGLFDWLAGAGVRWGLHARHRADLGLGAAGDQNTWSFGLRRMLLGYATGRALPFAGIDPYDEIGGLDAAAVGSLAEGFERLEDWWSRARGDATPVDWAARGRSLLGDFVDARDERERLTVAALQAALSAWLEACQAARFVEPVPLSVFREGWLSGIDGLEASRRFLTGGVTFCTLLPLRAVPFEVVCLLGMNDGDFPRRSRRADFDLMALAGHQRPGDRSRRDDDRYLMLEALLSARRVLYVSWSGRHARDNSEQPPSVLVAQLRDYLDAGWQCGDKSGDEGGVVASLTTEHPLQPFGRRYFEVGGLLTFAREWRAAHAADPDTSDRRDLPSYDETGQPLTTARLAGFLRNPVREFFRRRLDVVVPDDAEAMAEDEPFDPGPLERYQLQADLLDDPAALDDAGLVDGLARRVERLHGAGRLPMFGLGVRVATDMATTVRPMLERWHAERRAFPNEVSKSPLRYEAAGVAIDDWLDGVRSDGVRATWLEMTPSKLIEPGGSTIRSAKLLRAWVRMLVASACGHRVGGIVIGCDATLDLRPLPAADARAALSTLLAAWRDGMDEPLPFAAKTALAFVAGDRAADVYEARKGVHSEGHEFCLARMYPTFEALARDGRFERYAGALFGPLAAWVRTHATIVPPRGAVAVAADASAA